LCTVLKLCKALYEESLSPQLSPQQGLKILVRSRRKLACVFGSVNAGVTNADNSEVVLLATVVH
ncbi:MAG: hypothetical protein ACKESB_01490, partial [Candidatus Hodgkinia cicadicola]